MMRISLKSHMSLSRDKDSDEDIVEITYEPQQSQGSDEDDVEISVNIAT